MQTTLKLDAALLTRAEELTGIQDQSELVKEALKALIERENLRRPERLGLRKPKGMTPKSRHFDEHIYDTD